MEKTLMVGNDINNINSAQNSWESLIDNLIAEFAPHKNIRNSKKKPFPLLYEEIFLHSLSAPTRKVEKERQIKDFIAEQVQKIRPNEIHRIIRDSNSRNIITTNYEFSIEGLNPKKNNGIIDETRYSIFRYFNIKNKKYWHIHGDCNSPNTISLGYEHYIGQTQQMRNYIVSGTNYKSKSINKKPLIKRLAKNLNQSWIDLFFHTDIFIFGLALDFVETDLWWLLTYRARQMKYVKKNNFIRNKIFYFIPKELIKNRNTNSQEKAEILVANGVTVIDEFSTSNGKLKYYKDVLEYIEKGSH